MSSVFVAEYLDVASRGASNSATRAEAETELFGVFCAQLKLARAGGRENSGNVLMKHAKAKNTHKKNTVKNEQQAHFEAPKKAQNSNV